MPYVFRNRESLVRSEPHRIAGLDVQEDFALEHEEELVLLGVLVPGKSPSKTPRRTTASFTVVSV
jgi:hypothetical protein